MVIREQVIDFIIEEFGDYNPTFQNILNELDIEENELTQEQKELIISKVGY